MQDIRSTDIRSASQSKCSPRPGVASLLVTIALHGSLQAGAAFGAEELVELSQDDAQWVMPAKNYASTRYSGLAQINKSNVGDLAVAWTFSIGTTAGFEAAPIVVGDTM
jgi:alcohol dehydrogenase (cytochrome c)